MLTATRLLRGPHPSKRFSSWFLCLSTAIDRTSLLHSPSESPPEPTFTFGRCVVLASLAVPGLPVSPFNMSEGTVPSLN